MGAHRDKFSRTVYLNKTKELADVVISGLDKENFSDIDIKVKALIAENQETDAYVFKHPSVAGRIFGVVSVLTLLICFFYYMLIGVITSYYSADLYYEGLFLVGLSIAVILANMVVLFKFMSDIRYKSRYETYRELLENKSLEYIKSLSGYAKRKESIVVKDLKKAMWRNLIPQGHLIYGERVIVVSDEMYNRYIERQHMYDLYFNRVIQENRDKSNSEKLDNQIWETGEQYISCIQQYSTLIKDKKLISYIGRIEKMINILCFEVTVNPRCEWFWEEFVNYYIQATDGLLNAYAALDETNDNLKGTTLNKKEIIKVIETVVYGFEDIYKKMYEIYEKNIDNEIDVMGLSLREKE